MSMSRTELVGRAVIAVSVASLIVNEGTADYEDQECMPTLGDTYQECLARQRTVQIHCKELLAEIRRGEFERTDFELRALGELNDPYRNYALPIGFALATHCDVALPRVLPMLKPAIDAKNVEMGREAIKWIDRQCTGKNTAACREKTAQDAHMNIKDIRLLVSEEAIENIKNIRAYILETQARVADYMIDQDLVNKYADTIAFLPIDETTNEFCAPLDVKDFLDFEKRYIDEVCAALKDKLGEGATAYIHKLRTVWETKARPTDTREINKVGY